MDTGEPYLPLFNPKRAVMGIQNQWCFHDCSSRWQPQDQALTQASVNR